MADLKKAQAGLSKGSTFGGETDVVFDGFTVREMTKEEKDVVAARRAATKAGEGIPEVPTINEIATQTQEPASAGGDAKAKK